MKPVTDVNFVNVIRDKKNNEYVYTSGLDNYMLIIIFIQEALLERRFLNLSL